MKAKIQETSTYELRKVLVNCREIGRHPAAHLVKRAFDRVESNDFGLFKRALDKRSFDRIDMADFGLRRKRAFDRIARAEFGFEGLRRKRAFDRLSIADFGLRRKRAFDRLSGTEFGLVKRSADAPDSARDELIHDLASSIVAMRSSNAPLDVRSVDSKK